MRLTGRGDVNVRATHTKTMELTPAPSIGERATCVIAVDVRADRAALVPAGPVSITITVGDESFAFDAQANSSWSPEGTAVIRRSAVQLPGTLATHATASAADLPRSFVRALRSPDVAVLVEVRPRRGLPALVLAATDVAATRSTASRLAAELAVADAVVAEDAGARDAIASLRPDARPLDPRHLGELPHGRVLVVASGDLPGAMLPAELVDDRPVEVVGLPSRFAVAAASRSRAPITFVPAGTDLRAALRGTPSGHRLVVAVAADRLAHVLADAAQVRGSTATVLAAERTQPIRAGGDVPTLPRSGVVHCCFEPAPGDAAALDPPVRAALAALRADGVPTRTAARALAELTGWPRRRAYDTVLAADDATDAAGT